MDKWIQIENTDYEIHTGTCFCRRIANSQASGTPRGYYLKPKIHCSCVGYTIFRYSKKKGKSVRKFMSIRRLTGRHIGKDWIPEARDQIEKLNNKTIPEKPSRNHRASLPTDRQGKELCPWARGDISGEALRIYIY